MKEDEEFVAVWRSDEDVEDEATYLYGPCAGMSQILANERKIRAEDLYRIVLEKHGCLVLDDLREVFSGFVKGEVPNERFWNALIHECELQK